MEVPSHFLDHTFSMEVMHDPVSTPDGHTFERSAVEQWIRVRGTNPVTRAPLTLDQLTPNRALRGAIEEFLLSNQQVRAQIERLQRQRQEAQRQVNGGRGGMQRYICGISLSIMFDPVTAADGRVYERKHIEMWIDHCGANGGPVVSPLTRNPMGTALTPNPELRAEIGSFLDELDASSAAPLGESADVESVRSLNEIFHVMDHLQDILHQVLHGWEPPRVVVMGNQSAGKSTLLERLCMMRLFPRKRALCTSVPVVISIRRGVQQKPVTLEVWDRKANRQLGTTRIIPLESGDVDVSNVMAEVIAAQGTQVSVDRELRVSIVSPTLPPMNLVDLPGTVEYPDDLREQTHYLIDEYITQNRASSTFLLVIKADSTPGGSGAVRHVMQHGVADRTIGVFTFCDRLEGAEDRQLLLGWLMNEPDAKDNVPLEPYGYVGTMNKELASKPDESSHARLLRQAQKEPGWFRDEGFDAEIAAGRVGTQVLVNKINELYITHVRRTFVPRTVGRLLPEHELCDVRLAELGLPASPGDLSLQPQIDALRNAAVAAAVSLLGPSFDAAVEDFAASTLAGLEVALQQALPASTSMGIRDLQAQLSTLIAQAIGACTAAVASFNDSWVGRYSEALRDDAPPFRLQRFPGLVARLAELCAAEAPHLAAGTLEAATAFVERALRIDGPYVELDFALQARPATVTVSVACRKIIGTVLGIFTAGLVVPSPARIAESVAAMARDVFGDREQEREACRGARAEVYERRKHISHATRHLLKLVQPQLALEADEPLSETVAAVLPNIADLIRSGPGFLPHG